MTTRLVHPWCERNKEPILEALRQELLDRGTILEVGSGSGQHAVFFARHLPSYDWQPSDINDDNLASIRAWIEADKPANVRMPLRLEVTDADWGIPPVEAVFSANMIHITPWECCLGLLAGARRHLVAGGLLFLYGPFRIDGRHTADSNRDFDEGLQKRDPRWGVRDLEAVCNVATGFTLKRRAEMPANNQLLVLQLVAKR